MRLLLINSEYPPIGAGAGNASANIARELTRAGHEVKVVTAGYADLPREQVVDGIHVLRGPSRRRRAERSTAGEQVLFILGATWRCLGVVGSFHPDAVLAFFGLPSGAVAFVLKALYRIPYVVSLRGGDVPGFRPYDFWLYHRLAVPFLRAIWRGAFAVVANSRGLRALAAAFDARTPVDVIPNGVAAERYWEPTRTWINRRLLSVGRVVHQKGLDLAVQALSELKDLDWEWRIAGDGPQMGSIRSGLAQSGIDERVTTIGWADSSQLVAEYQEASLFVMPSRHEGMPNAVLEAMAAGLPVIATRIAGNEELVVDGETGRLVPPEDVSALRACIVELLGDRSQRERMGRAAHRRVAESYGWDTTARRYSEILERSRR